MFTCTRISSMRVSLALESGGGRAAFSSLRLARMSLTARCRVSKSWYVASARAVFAAIARRWLATPGSAVTVSAAVRVCSPT